MLELAFRIADEDPAATVVVLTYSGGSLANSRRGSVRKIGFAMNDLARAIESYNEEEKRRLELGLDEAVTHDR